MKKKILSILSILATVCISASCSTIPDNSGSSSSNSTDLSTDLSTESSSDNSDSSELPDDSSFIPDDSTESESGDSTDGSTTPDDPIPDDPTPDDEKKFVAFTAEEQTLYTQYVGEIIPFLANDEYGVEAYYTEQPENYWEGLCFYTVGNTEQQFEEYRKLFTAYTLQETVEKEGDTWYIYAKGDDIVVEMVHYEYEGELWTEVYAYNLNYISNDPDYYEYTDFTAEEKEIFQTYVKATIPFMPTNEYYIEGLASADNYLDGLYLLAYDNTPAEFVSYCYALLADRFTLAETYTERGVVWFAHQKNTLRVEVCGYYDILGYVVEMRILDTVLSSVTTEKTPDGQTLLTNKGKGLPTDESGVYSLDFTKTSYTKNATEQGMYLNGCPTMGNVKVLVIPVEFSDATAASKGYAIDKIQKVFNDVKDNDDFYSVKEYFATSSYGQLSLEFTVIDEWFMPQYASSHYKGLQLDSNGYMMDLGEQLVIDEALAHLSQTMDLSDYDSDNNGTIDAVIIINTMNVKTSPTFHWAFRYWNVYTNDKGNFYTYDGVYLNDYIWAAYGFLQQKVGYQNYDNGNPLNSYTYAHEFSHILGSEDYYDTSYILQNQGKEKPLAGKDVMDNIYGDHNPYTKFHLGWLTTSRLIVAEKSVTVTLESFHKNGDTVIIANNWDDRLGAYQEYYVLMYYRIEGLNNGDVTYFNKDGIVVYHVNASLVEQNYGQITYDVYNNNTYENGNNGYGTRENLIELVKNTKGTYIYGKGDTIASGVVDDYGNSLTYNFTVDSLVGDTATLTFTKQTKGELGTDDKPVIGDNVIDIPIGKKE